MTKTGRILRLLLPILLLGISLFLWLHRWDVYDYWRMRSYQPLPQVAQLATDTSMNSKARRLFYVYHPDLEDKATFNEHCNNTERTIVLGCYVSGRGIYVYNVTEPRLEGVIQVTSAHEMLHAAYERLNGNDKFHVNELLNQAYDKITDQRIRTNIDDYRQNGANVTNELHSILGTEVRNLPPELEHYYMRYFTNRLTIVDFSEKYEQAFTARKQQVALDDQKLKVLKKQIEDLQTSLSASKSALDVMRQQLDGLLAAKQYEEYNKGVPAFNTQVGSFNNQVRYISTLIDQYNALVAERNAIATEESELVKAIDSRPSTIDNQ